jgi:hypothetical protein
MKEESLEESCGPLWESRAWLMELMTSCILHSQRQNREVGWGTESSGLSCHLGEPGAWLGDSLHSPPLSPHSSPADDQCHLLTDSITFSDILVTMLSVLATGCKLLLSPDSGHWDPGARKLLVLSGKEFKNGHRGDTSRSGFIYAKSKAKTLSRREGGKTQDSVVCCAGGPKTLSFYWCLWTWGWSVLENWLYVSSTSREWAMRHQLLPHIRQESSWAWMVRSGLLCHQATGCCRMLLYVTCSFVNISSPGCSAIRFHNS